MKVENRKVIGDSYSLWGVTEGNKWFPFGPYPSDAEDIITRHDSMGGFFGYLLHETEIVKEGSGQ